MRAEIHLRLYEELNEYLPPDRRKRRFGYPLEGIGKIRDLLSRLGVPEDEVELVVINGDSVSFSAALAPGDFVSLYPVFESFDVTTLLREREKTLRDTRFIVDAGLGELAGSLRSLGFDVREAGTLGSDEIVRCAEQEKRILLTRNSEFLKYPELSRAYVIQQPDSRSQLSEILSRLDL